jgi:hypothetical protein
MLNRCDDINDHARSLDTTVELIQRNTFKSATSCTPKPTKHTGLSSSVFTAVVLVESVQKSLRRRAQFQVNTFDFFGGNMASWPVYRQT